MVFQLDRIVRDVRVCLDENRTDAPLLEEGDSETLTLEEAIRSKVTQGVDRVQNMAPYHLLEQGHNFDGGSDAVYWGDQESGWVLLPEDYMRLVVFEMSDWERPVFVPIEADSLEYKYQRSRFKGLRGTAQRPVCAVVQRPEGLSLEFYSCKSRSAKIKRAVYTPYSRIDKGGGVDISERCYDAVVNTVAGLTMVACGETERASAFFGLSDALLGIRRE